MDFRQAQRLKGKMIQQQQPEVEWRVSMPRPGIGGLDGFVARARGDSQESEWTLDFLQE